MYSFQRFSFFPVVGGTQCLHRQAAYSNTLYLQSSLLRFGILRTWIKDDVLYEKAVVRFTFNHQSRKAKKPSGFSSEKGCTSTLIVPDLAHISMSEPLWGMLCC